MLAYVLHLKDWLGFCCCYRRECILISKRCRHILPTYNTVQHMHDHSAVCSSSGLERVVWPFTRALLLKSLRLRMVRFTLSTTQVDAISGGPNILRPQWGALHESAEHTWINLVRFWDLEGFLDLALFFVWCLIFSNYLFAMLVALVLPKMCWT